MTKYLDPPSVGIGVGPKISEYIRSKGAEEKESLLLKGILFVCQNDWKYNQNFETELNLNDLEKLTTEDEIRMDDQDELAIDQVRRWQW